MKFKLFSTLCVVGLLSYGESVPWRDIPFHTRVFLDKLTNETTKITIIDAEGNTNEVDSVSAQYLRDLVGPMYNSIYYVVTNSVDYVGPVELDGPFEGIALDLYNTNSLYFVDGLVPTIKFWAPNRRYAYLGNRFSQVEIGDPYQALHTYNLQADGNIAVLNPSRIRFMETLDPNNYYATCTTLQDYFDAFNPTLIDGILHSYVLKLGGGAVTGDLSVAGTTLFKGDTTIQGNATISGNIIITNATAVNVNKLSLTDGNLRVGNTLNITQNVNHNYVIIEYEVYTNQYNEVVINRIQAYSREDITTNCNASLNGSLSVAGSQVVASNLFVGSQLKIVNPSSIVMPYYGIRTSADGSQIVDFARDYESATNTFLYMTLDHYLDIVHQNLIQITNKWYKAYTERGKACLDVTSLPSPSAGYTSHSGAGSYDYSIVSRQEDEGTAICYVSNNIICAEFDLRNWKVYELDGAKFNSWSSRRIRNSNNYIVTASSTNIYVRLPRSSDPSNLDLYFTCDLTTSGNNLYINFISENFSSDNFTTVYSTSEPDVRQEQVYHEEVYTWYDWIYDEDIGDYVEDYDNPHTETRGWWDTYTIDYTWIASGGSVTDFHIMKMSDKKLLIDKRTLYKSNP